jgi:hypothetical protein
MLVQGMICEAMWMWFHKFWGAKDPQFIICAKMIEIEGSTKNDMIWFSTHNQPLAPGVQGIVLPLGHT